MSLFVKHRLDIQQSISRTNRRITINSSTSKRLTKIRTFDFPLDDVPETILPQLHALLEDMTRTKHALSLRDLGLMFVILHCGLNIEWSMDDEDEDPDAKFNVRIKGRSSNSRRVDFQIVDTLTHLPTDSEIDQFFHQVFCLAYELKPEAGPTIKSYYPDLVLDPTKFSVSDQLKAAALSTKPYAAKFLERKLEHLRFGERLMAALKVLHEVATHDKELKVVSWVRASLDVALREADLHGLMGIVGTDPELIRRILGDAERLIPGIAAQPELVKALALLIEELEPANAKLREEYRNLLNEFNTTY